MFTIKAVAQLNHKETQQQRAHHHHYQLQLIELHPLPVNYYYHLNTMQQLKIFICHFVSLHQGL